MFRLHGWFLHHELLNGTRSYEGILLMIIDVECPQCNGMGEVCGVNPNRRSRFVGMDDLSPDDYATQCPKCLGSGTVERDMNDEVEDWME